MNTAQITHALEEDPITKKKRFVVYFPVINYLKRSTSILADLSRTQIRVASLELTGFQFGSVQVMLGGTTTRFWGNILTATGLIYHWCLETIWEKHTDKWKYNKRKLQSIWSDVCGGYCILYLSHRARGYSMNKIVQLFDDNTMLNDVKVSHFVKTHFRVSANHPNVNIIQFSKNLVQ